MSSAPKPRTDLWEQWPEPFKVTGYKPDGGHALRWFATSSEAMDYAETFPAAILFSGTAKSKGRAVRKWNGASWLAPRYSAKGRGVKLLGWEGE